MEAKSCYPLCRLSGARQTFAVLWLCSTFATALLLLTGCGEGGTMKVDDAPKQSNGKQTAAQAPAGVQESSSVKANDTPTQANTDKAIKEELAEAVELAIKCANDHWIIRENGTLWFGHRAQGWSGTVDHADVQFKPVTPNFVAEGISEADRLNGMEWRGVVKFSALATRTSTMGEPLLYEHFEEIIALCREFNVRLNLTTNGTFPRLGAQRWAELIVPVTSDTKISWNGATERTQEAIMRGAKWERVVQNLREFIAVRDKFAQRGENRCRVTMQLTFLESNLAEIPAIVRIAASLGVDRVKGHHVWAHFNELENLNLRRNGDSIGRWNETVLAARAAAAETLLSNGEPVLLENFHLLEESGVESSPRMSRCQFLGREAWVSAEGRFNPCCAPDAQRQTLGEFGNLNERSLGEIWDSPEYRHLIATYHSRPLCQQCTMRQPV